METQNFDYFMTAKDTAVLQNLSKMGEHLAGLKQKMEETAAAAELAKKEYEHYAHNLLPAAMHSAGVESLAMADGSTMSVNRQYYCSPNKNADDQKILADWLKDNQGEFLLQKVVTAAPGTEEKLREAGIPYSESSTVNTQKLKAFIKDKLGITSGIAQISLDDIPKCLHFQEVTTVELKTN